MLHGMVMGSCGSGDALRVRVMRPSRESQGILIRESTGRAQGKHRESTGRAQGEHRESTGTARIDTGLVLSFWDAYFGRRTRQAARMGDTVWRGKINTYVLLSFRERHICS